MQSVGFSAVMVVMLALIAAMFVCAGVSVYRWTKPLWGRLGGKGFTVIYCAVILVVLGIFMGGRGVGNSVPLWLHRMDHYAVGYLVYGVLWVDLLALILLLLRKLHVCSEGNVLLLGRILLIVGVLLITYGGIHGRAVVLREYAVSLADEGESTKQLQIVLISDLHLGYVMDAKRLQEIVEKVNEQKPDIVCIAGDVFDGDITAVKEPEAVKAAFDAIEATYGVYACFGNHDAGSTYEEMVHFLEDTQVRLLQDEGVSVGGIYLVGRRDSSPIGAHGEAREGVSLAAADGQPVIVMDHQPGNIGEYGEDVDLVLCGHTHKGQIALFELITNALFEVDYGYYRKDRNSPHIIVTSGAGTWGPPQRIGSNCEVVSILVEY